MAKEVVAKAKPMEPFPLEFLIFSEGMTGLMKDWNLYISGAEHHSCLFHLTARRQAFPLPTASVAVIYFLAFPQAYLCPAFISLLWTVSVYVSRFLTPAIKENLVCNTRSNTYPRGLSLSKFIRIWMLIYSLLHPTTSAFELQEFNSCVLPRHPNIISFCVKDALGITCPVSERFQ